MTVLQAVVLGVVQGITEFLPISSKTHLVVVPALLGWRSPSLPFLVLLHLGTFVGILAYFARELLGIATGALRGDMARRRTIVLLVAASIPAAVLGLALEETFERLLGRPRAAGLALIVTAAILLVAEWRTGALRRGGLPRPVRHTVTMRDAVAMGLAQAVALLPGVSRSGSTMGAGLASGVGREAAAHFSFLMALPAIAGATVLEAPAILDAGIGAPQVAGLTASLVSGYAAIWWLLRYLKRRSFVPFAVYCAAFAVLAWFRLG